MSGLLTLIMLVVVVIVVVVVALMVVLGGAVTFVLLVAGLGFLWFKLAPKPLALEGEVLRVIPANHFKGIEGRGGRLTVTDRELSFGAHAFNFQRGPVRIGLDEVESIVPYEPLGIAPTGIRVRTKSGQVHRFVAQNRDEVMAFLRETCGLAAE